jgi:hypothetical protein
VAAVAPADAPRELIALDGDERWELEKVAEKGNSVFHYGMEALLFSLDRIQERNVVECYQQS